MCFRKNVLKTLFPETCGFAQSNLRKTLAVSADPIQRRRTSVSARISWHTILACLCATSLAACGTLSGEAADPAGAADVDTPAGEPQPAAPPTATLTPEPAPPVEEGVQGWAVIAVKEDYSDVGMTDLRTGFLNVYELRSLLSYFGWQDDHIIELLDHFDAFDLRLALDWLAESADEDDVVLFFYQGHGTYTSDYLRWEEFFPEQWAEVPSQRRILVMETCFAGAFIAASEDDPNPHISVGAVAADELGWVGLWEEGLPIVGGAFTHFFLEAFTDPTADTDSDGAVSVQEAALFADENQRTYMWETVWPVEEFAEWKPLDPEAPHVVVDAAAGEPVYLDLSAYDRLH
jgi:hypothetical protein